jgi:hypothetical protein
MRPMSMEPAGSPGGSIEGAEDGTGAGLDPSWTSGIGSGAGVDGGAGADGADGASFDLSMAVSQLASNSTDLRLMLKLLVAQLSDALGDRISVERAGRFRKSDEIKSVRISLGDDTLEAVVDGGTVRCTIGHSSGGIRIRSERVDIGAWLTRLLTTLQSEAASSEQTRLALENIVIGGQS